MAVTREEDLNLQDSKLGQQPNVGINNDSSNDVYGVDSVIENAMKSRQINEFITFNDGIMGLDSVNIANTVSNEITKALRLSDNAKNVEVTTFDKKIYRAQYSYISLSVPSEATKNVYFYVLLLSETGIRNLTLSEFIDRVEADGLNDKSVTGVFTPDIMIDDRTLSNVIKTLQEKYPGYKAIEIGSTVVSDQMMPKLHKVSEHAFKHLIAAVTLDVSKDLNLQNALEAEIAMTGQPTDHRLHYKSIPEGYIINGIGDKVKADFSIGLIKNTKVRGFNTSNNDDNIATVYGYLDYVVEEVEISNGTSKLLEPKLVPHVIITNMEIYRLTTNFSMLALVLTGLFARKDILISHMMRNRDEIATTIAIILGGGSDKLAKDIESLRVLDDDKFLEALHEQVFLQPIISLDLENNGATEFLSAFTNAVVSGDATTLLNSAASLSGDNSFMNIPFGPIAKSVILPKISYHENGIRDGRDFTLTYILDRTKDIEMAKRYSAIVDTNLGIIDLVELLSDIIGDIGTVDGTILRVTIQPAFIDKLYRSLNLNSLTYNSQHIPQLRTSGFGAKTESYRMQDTNYFRPAGANAGRNRGAYNPYRY